MTEIYYIKEQVEVKGLSYAEVARRTNTDPRTIKKYVEMEDFSEKFPVRQKRRKPIMDSVIPVVDQWLKEDMKKKKKYRLTAKRIYTLLVDDHSFEGSERTVRNYVAAKKIELQEECDAAALPLEAKAGCAQVDFGEAPFEENGAMVDKPYLVLSFPYSNTFYYQVFHSQNRECFLEGLARIFDRLKGIPKAIRFDNLSPAVKKVLPHGERELTEEFERFVAHYNFEYEFCNPNSGNEKGHVESMVKYIRNNFLLPALPLQDIEYLNGKFWDIAEKDRNRIHYEKGKLIAELHTEDLENLRQLPSKRFESARFIEAKADKYGFVKVDTRSYSTSPRFARQKVYVKVMYNKVSIYNEENEVIITHDRLYSEQKKSMIWEPYLNLMAKRPTAIKYTSFYEQLPLIWQKYFDNCAIEEKKQGLQLISVLFKEKNFDLANRALEMASEHSHPSADSIKQIYFQLLNGRGLRDTIQVSTKVPSIPSVSRGVSQYDKLYQDMNGESR